MAAMQNPFAPPEVAPPHAPQRSSRRLWLFGCVGCGGLLVLVVGGILAVGIWAVEEDGSAAVERHAGVIAELGNPVECDVDWGRSIDDDRIDHFHYRCRGDKGSGAVDVVTEPTGEEWQEEVVEGVLVLSDGTRVVL
jgi:hypothetical protein